MKYNDISNKNRKYVLPYLKNKPSKIEDIINDKYEKIHIQLYKSALNKFVYSDDIIYDKDNNPYELFTFIEIRNNVYNKPSKVMVINKRNPMNKKIYDLTKYWDNYHYDIDNKDISNIQINNYLLENNIGENVINNSEIIYIDYVRGFAKLRNRITDTEFNVDLSFINNEIKKADEYSLSNTFAYNKDLDSFKNLFI